MLIAIADFLDGLWSTTSRTVITKTFVPTSVPLRAVLEVPETEDNKEYDCITVNGTHYIIPPNVINRPPLFVNDAPNFKDFPNLREVVLVSKYASPGHQTLLVDGLGVSRNHSVHGVTRDAAETMLSVHQREDARTMGVDYVDLEINLFRGEGWSHIKASRPGKSDVDIFHLTAPGLPPSSVEISMAYMYARTILLMLLAGNDVIYNYDENILAGHLVAAAITLRGAA